MYEWKIDIIFKSGKEYSSAVVAERFFTGDVNTLNGFGNKEGTKDIYIKIGEVAAVSISVA